MAAYDGYRSQPDPHQPPYDSHYSNPQSYPPSSYSQNAHCQDVRRPRSRASSSTPSEAMSQPFQQPLHNALNNAFDKSDTARAVNPDLIAQITAEVKRSVLDEIKMNGVAGVTGQPQPHPTPPQYVPQSPTSTSASFPSRNVYTPPENSSHGSASPDPLAQDPMFDGVDDTPTPRCERSAPVDIPHQGRSRSRPAPAQRMSTDADFTPIEKMWQRLFDPQGQPMPRLGQFLRGLAIHLIDDYEPKKSLVISPAKMLRFYNDVKLPDEIYPWQTIFGKLSCPTLTKIYREMRCQHHLIQENLADQPQVPALTPQGFQEWMTAMIQAYPDNEYQRLSKAVLDMPISNADDCKERFPKELPRRLFPHGENLQAQQRCAAALFAGGVGPLRRAPAFPPPPPMGQNNGAAPGVERERSPYASRSNTRDSRAVESDEEDEPLAVPIERERKPYTAAPGGGKVYDDNLSRSMQSDSSIPDHRNRTQSTASQWSNTSHTSHASQLQQQQQHQHHHHPRTYSTTTGRRPRSPSFSGYGTRSDPNVGNMPGSYYSSNMYDSEDEKMKRNDWARRQAEEGSGAHSRRSTAGWSDSSYDSQPRSVHEDDYYRGRSNTTNGYDNRSYDSRRY